MKRKATQTRQSRRWCFTSYDPVYVGNPVVLRERFAEGAEYLVYQREVCPNTGKKHIQGYVVLEKKKTLAGVKKWLNDASAHCEQTLGSDAQAADYCTKDESRDTEEGMGPFEFGIFVCS